MTDHVPGGCFLMARTIFQSAIWKKPPQCFRLFFWLVGNANHDDGYIFKGHVLLRGQVITTYSAIADALSYCFNKSIIRPTVKEIRIMLFWLQSEGMITVKPLIDGTLTHKGRPSDAQGQLRTITTIKTFLSNSNEVRLSELLLEKILLRNPNHKKPNIQTWAKDVDRMIRIDLRIPEDIQRVIEWCQADPFWQNTILSAGKLRKQFDQLWLKMGTDGKRAAPVSLPKPLTCPRCGRELVVKSDLYGDGCVYCERFTEVRA